MSGLDVEALLDSTATNGKHEEDDRHQSDRADRRDRDRYRESSRDRDRDRKRRDRSREHRKDRVHDDELKSPHSEKGSTTGSHKSRRRSRSRDGEKRSKRDRSSGGDYYRNGRRSRSPDDRYYRPKESHRSKRDHEQEAPRARRRSRSRDRRSKTPEIQLTEDERDKRTVFVQQLAARLRTRELIQFFEKIGPVKEAQIVKDRVSGRSKGYVFNLVLRATN